MTPKLVKLITKNHTSTKRNYGARMISTKSNIMKISKNMDLIIGMEIENLVMVVTMMMEGGNQ